LLPCELGSGLEQVEPAAVVVAHASHELIEDVEAEDAARDDGEEDHHPQALEVVVGLAPRHVRGAEPLNR
jgi:hypothetical protein